MGIFNFVREAGAKVGLGESPKEAASEAQKDEELAELQHPVEAPARRRADTGMRTRARGPTALRRRGGEWVALTSGP